MTLLERAKAYASTFPDYPASHLQLVQEHGEPVLYGRWLMGNDYRNKTRYYGAYPPSYLYRVRSLFPDVAPGPILHVFSGSLPKGSYWRLDCNPELRPELLGDVLQVRALVDEVIEPGKTFKLVFADPPYSDADAKRYGTPMIDRKRVFRALADVVAIGGFVVWLDCVWPQHSKDEWRTVARIAITRSTNHRIRDCTIFERRVG